MSKPRYFPYISKKPARNSGVNDGFELTTSSHGRYGTESDHDNPLLIPNEWIASNIAQHLRLPVPPFALLKNAKDQPLFASLHVTREPAPPGTDPEKCIALDERLCAGITVFDAFVANTDRWSGNILVDDLWNPSWMQIIDNDRAVFGCMPGDELKRLSQLSIRTGLLAPDWPGACRHCLIDHLTDAMRIHEWLLRIESIPDWFLSDICHEIVGNGISRNLAEAAYGFLRERKRSLRGLVYNIRQEFSQVRPDYVWGFIQ